MNGLMLVLILVSVYLCVYSDIGQVVELLLQQTSVFKDQRWIISVITQ